MLVYLDNCCYNRPYDSQSQIVISLETQAKLFIQEQIVVGKIRLASSYVLHIENDMNKISSKRSAIRGFVERYSSVFVDSSDTDGIEFKAKLKFMDACHLACAIFAGSDYFLSTDYRLLKFKTNEIIITNPVDFIRELREFL